MKKTRKVTFHPCNDVTARLQLIAAAVLMDTCGSLLFIAAQKMFRAGDKYLRRCSITFFTLCLPARLQLIKWDLGVGKQKPTRGDSMMGGGGGVRRAPLCSLAKTCAFPPSLFFLRDCHFTALGGRISARTFSEMVIRREESQLCSRVPYLPQ